jgi:glutaminyl-tRNA synthetase
MLEAVNNPEDAAAGSRQVPFTRELYIEQEDFMEDAPRKFFRLKPGGEVRLRYAYIVTCDQVIKDPETGEITELHCSYDPATRSGTEEGNARKVKGTIHWVSATKCINAEVRIYDRMFLNEDPEDVPAGQTFLDNMNPDCLEIVEAKVEPELNNARAGDRFQFERLGYFCVDAVDSTADRLVFNRTVPLRDSWGKMQAKGQAD